jgi:hypothetical protein
MNIEEGDWVSFYLDNKLTISCVRYIMKNRYGLPELDYYTDRGVIPEKRILEVRKPNEDN